MTPTTSGFVHVGAASAAVFIVIAAADLPIWQSFAGVAAGALLGRVSGSRRGRQLESSADLRGGIVLYVDRAALHILAAELTLLALSPIVFGTAIGGLSSVPRLQALVQLVFCTAAGAWLAHDVAVARHLRRLESRFGRLDVQWFHSDSVVGPEAMIGRDAIVTTACMPCGLVRVSGELWQAESLDRQPIPAGERVVVRRLRGLTVVVEAAESN